MDQVKEIAVQYGMDALIWVLTLVVTTYVAPAAKRALDAIEDEKKREQIKAAAGGLYKFVEAITSKTANKYDDRAAELYAIFVREVGRSPTESEKRNVKQSLALAKFDAQFPNASAKDRAMFIDVLASTAAEDHLPQASQRLVKRAGTVSNGDADGLSGSVQITRPVPPVRSVSVSPAPSAPSARGISDGSVRAYADHNLPQSASATRSSTVVDPPRGKED